MTPHVYSLVEQTFTPKWLPLKISNFTCTEVEKMFFDSPFSSILSLENVHISYSKLPIT